ncbi:CDP-alcohol phosphatidyltransferase family protein [Streptosporangium lutulentum]
MRAYSLNDVHATRKRRDSWWTVFLVDPVACRLTLFVANHTAITPNGLTRLSLILGMVSAVCFGFGQLVAGALVFYVSFAVDCMDGKIARLKGTGTAFGLWLDYVGDRIRVVCCAVGLAFGQYVTTGDVAYILLGAGVAVLDLFRYVNAPQMKRVREVVKENRLERLAADAEAAALTALTALPESRESLESLECRESLDQEIPEPIERATPRASRSGRRGRGWDGSSPVTGCGVI